MGTKRERGSTRGHVTAGLVTSGITNGCPLSSLAERSPSAVVGVSSALPRSVTEAMKTNVHDARAMKAGTGPLPLRASQAGDGAALAPGAREVQHHRGHGADLGGRGERDHDRGCSSLALATAGLLACLSFPCGEIQRGPPAEGARERWLQLCSHALTPGAGAARRLAEMERLASHCGVLVLQEIDG